MDLSNLYQLVTGEQNIARGKGDCIGTRKITQRYIHGSFTLFGTHCLKFYGNVRKWGLWYKDTLRRRADFGVTEGLLLQEYKNKFKVTSERFNSKQTFS